MAEYSANSLAPPSFVFGSILGHMEAHLRAKFGATDEEIAYLKQILELRTKNRKPLSLDQSGYSSPSVVIDGFLYHGDFEHASNTSLLTRLGIRHIIDACDCKLAEEVQRKFNVLWINVYDELGSNVRKYFDQTNEFLYRCRQKNEKVLVHCQMGISRSSSIVLAYLMKYHHDSLIKAYDYLLERRRAAAPNMSFFLQLIRYEKELRATKEIDETKHNDDQTNPIERVDRRLDSPESEVD